MAFDVLQRLIRIEQDAVLEMLLPQSHTGKGASTNSSQSNHPAKALTNIPQGASGTQTGAQSSAATVPGGANRYVPPAVDTSRVVQKPVSRTQVDDPREFQIQQLRRRFSPKEVATADGTSLTFSMAPSDPDFPFEMAGLECVLHVPSTYPVTGKPSLDVKNKEMGRGYQINVERGLDSLVAKSPQTTLLGLMNSLDKQLESLLTEQKAETIKIVPNTRTNIAPTQFPPPSSDQHPAQDTKTKPVASEQIFTPAQKQVAAARREAETRQLEARLGRLPLFFKSSDGIAYTLPIEPRKQADLPVPLQVVKTVRLFVPLLYPLQPCRVELLGVARHAASNTERWFVERVHESPAATLMAHINYLSQNMHVLATEPPKENPPDVLNSTVNDLASLNLDNPTPSAAVENKVSKPIDPLDDRTHIQHIPRPPEWGVPGQESQGESESSDYYDSGDESSDEGQGVELETVPENVSSAPERGILLSFPYLELHGIELLEVVSLSITVKCERCKDQIDVKNLRSSTRETGDAPATKMESCKKCASSLTIGFRKELMHANSVRAGYLDLNGCTVVDMLPR
ncbi:hypothetical protein MMC13_006420 [Lambiella insularis]|nr:hypothetical protein [Lambiella insularis]